MPAISALERTFLVLGQPGLQSKRKGAQKKRHMSLEGVVTAKEHLLSVT